MSVKKITEKVFCITTRIHKPNLRFEGIWEVPNGVTINSYLIRGEKNVLIDGTLGDDESGNGYIKDLAELGMTLSDIDVVVLNHMEPDHSGFIRRIASVNPKVQFYATAKGVAFVKNFFKITENLHAVTDNETLPLGGSDELRFFETPNVHWPETMMTYYAAEGALFSCDCFGGYGDVSAKLLDAENSEADIRAYDEEVLRYYATVMASFNTFILKAIDKVPSDVRIICPSHGIIWGKQRAHIIDLYKKLAGYGTTCEFDKEVCVIWGSMYGYTKQGVDAVVRGLERKGVPYTMLQIPDMPTAYVLAAAYKAKCLVLAMPTYEYKMFPPMAHILDLFERKHFYKKNVLRLGSWGWVGGAKREYEQRIEKMQWTNLPSYEWQGVPLENDLAELEKLGEQLAETL